MKALTIKQPWAELIACGDKRVENRSWKTNYRGPIAIHAGVDRSVVKLIGPESVDDFVYGAVIATADIVDCVRYGDKNANLTYPWLATSTYAEGPWCWILKHAKRLKKPVPAKGKLSFWEWNP